MTPDSTLAVTKTCPKDGVHLSTSSGAPMPRGSTPARRAGAGSSARSITAPKTWVGWHVAKRGDRWAALEPIRQGVQQTHGQYAPQIAVGLGLRMDWGPQYTARQFLGELRWLGIRPSPSYVGEPECNGIMERWMRTLKEECLYLYDFATLDEARQVIGEFIERYNQQWLLERHGHRTPAEVRQMLTSQAA